MTSQPSYWTSSTNPLWEHVQAATSQFMRFVARPPKVAASKRAAGRKPAAKPCKSAELVEDSDEEEDETTVPEKIVHPLKPTNEHSRTKGGKIAPIEPASKAPKPTQKRKSPTPSATESQFNRTDIESLARSPTPKKFNPRSIPPKSEKDDPHSKVTSTGENGKKAVERSSSVPGSREDSSGDRSDSELEDSTSRLNEEAPRSQKLGLPKSTSPKKRAPERKKQVITGSVSGISEPGDGAESESGGDEANSGGESDEPTANAIAKPNPQYKAPQITYIPYALPAGFEAISKAPAHPASQQAELFSPASLQGKEIWHITVPAGVSISSIKEVAQQSVQDGSAVLSYKGTPYGLIAEAEGGKSRETLLLPSDGGNDYKPSKHRITKTLHLQQLVRPQTGTRVHGDLSKFTASRDRPHHENQTPQQPEGMKMRYKPFGTGDSDSSSSETATKPSQKGSQFRVPKGTEASLPARKRKRDEPDDQGPSRSRSPKKARRDSQSMLSPAVGITGKEASLTKPTPKEHKQPDKTVKPSTPIRKPEAPPHSTNGQTSVSKKEVHDAQDSSSKRKRKKRKTGDDGNSTPQTHTDHDRKLSITKSNTEEAHTSASRPKPATEAITNGKVPTPIKVPSNSQLPKQKEKPRKKYPGSLPLASATSPNKDPNPAKVHGSPTKILNPSHTRSDHDEDATAVAKSPEEQFSSKSVKVINGDNAKASSGKKSKHEGETLEERAERRAERKKRKEMRSNGTVLV